MNMLNSKQYNYEHLQMNSTNVLKDHYTVILDAATFITNITSLSLIDTHTPDNICKFGCTASVYISWFYHIQNDYCF